MRCNKKKIKAMMLDYLRHFKLYLDEINELINLWN